MMYCNTIPLDFEASLDIKSFKTSEANDRYIIGMANKKRKTFSFCLSPRFAISKEAERALDENGYWFFSSEEIGFDRVRFTVRRPPKRIKSTLGHLVEVFRREGVNLSENVILCIHSFGEDMRVAFEEDYDTDFFHVCLHDGVNWWWTGEKLTPDFVGLLDVQS